LRDTVSEFEERRAQTWRAGKYWLGLLLAGIVGAVIFTKTGSELFAMLFIFGGCVAIGALFLVMRRGYRCPACEEILDDEEGAILLFPRACRRCGAKLRR